jgi:hypothetical protein
MNIATSIEAGIRGLALGDAFSSQSAVHRLNLVGNRRVRRFQILNTVASQMKHTTRPEPYVNSYSPSLIKPRPSDDCEWFYFAHQIATKKLSFADEWSKLSRERERILARAGTHAALRNIANGKKAPISGHDNTHYFDSISLIHALAIASVEELDSTEVNNLLLDDISWTHSEDGIWCAQALAEATIQLRNGIPIKEAIQAGLRFLPENSWSRREVLRAINLTSDVRNHLERAALLEENYVDQIYAFPYGAPETLGLLFAHTQHFKDAELFFSSSFLHKRHIDSLPPLMGFMAGLLGGSQWIPSQFREGSIIMDGVCIPSLKNVILTS